MFVEILEVRDGSWANGCIIPKAEIFRGFFGGFPDPKPPFKVTNRRVGRYNLPRVMCLFEKS